MLSGPIGLELFGKLFPYEGILTKSVASVHRIARISGGCSAFVGITWRDAF